MNTNENHSFRLPAEWEPQSGIILIWPHEDTDWRPYLNEITEVYLQMADAITRYEPLLITVRDTEKVHSLLAERLTEGQMKRVTLFACDNNDTWARDVAPSHSYQTRIQKVAYKHFAYSTFVSTDGARSSQQKRTIELTANFMRQDSYKVYWRTIRTSCWRAVR